MLRLIRDRIIDVTNNYPLVLSINTKFGTLKELRLNSDYWDEELSDDVWKAKSNAAFDLSRQLINLLNVNIIQRKK